MNSRPDGKGLIVELGRLAGTTCDVTAFLGAANQMLEQAVGWDYASWSIVDPGTTLFTYTTLYGATFDPWVRSKVIELEFASPDVTQLSDLAHKDQPVESLLVATRGKPTASRRFREVLQEIHCQDELRAAFTSGGMAWGFLIAYRSVGGRPFSRDDTLLVSHARHVIAEGIRHCLLRTAAEVPDRLPDGPGLMLLSDDGHILETNPVAERWLSMMGGPADWLTAVHSVAAKTKMRGLIVHLPLQARRTGQWILLHGSATANGTIAIIIEEARGAHLSNAISDLYGLTSRERAVTEQVLQGRSTKEIGDSLGISLYTVQDHLKSIFDKVGVRSRLALASAFFSGCYADRRQAGSVPSPYGWYLDDGHS